MATHKDGVVASTCCRGIGDTVENIAALPDLFILRGVPAYIKSAMVLSFIAGAVRDWIAAAGAQTVNPTPGFGTVNYKSNWAAFLPQTSNLNAEQSMSYEFVDCLIFGQMHLP